MLKELLNRTHKNARNEREVITEAFKILDGVKEQTVAIRGDSRLSKTGVTAKLVEIASEPWKSLGGLRDKSKAMSADIEKFRRKMVPTAPEDAYTISLHVSVTCKTSLGAMPTILNSSVRKQFGFRDWH